MQNKKHWYDGKVYGVFIDPFIRDSRKCISSLIENGSTVVDIGFGTGSLVFFLSNKCESILGIEISKKMVDYANSIKEKNNFRNVRFIHSSAEDLSKITKEKFDYAIFSLSLHEMDTTSRQNSLQEVKKIANKVIIYDYLEKYNLDAIFVEFFAGINNFKNYKSFIKNGGVEALLRDNGFELEKKASHNRLFVIVKARCK